MMRNRRPRPGGVGGRRSCAQAGGVAERHRRHVDLDITGARLDDMTRRSRNASTDPRSTRPRPRGACSATVVREQSQLFKQLSHGGSRYRDSVALAAEGTPDVDRSGDPIHPPRRSPRRVTGVTPGRVERLVEAAVHEGVVEGGDDVRDRQGRPRGRRRTGRRPRGGGHGCRRRRSRRATAPAH